MFLCLVRGVSFYRQTPYKVANRKKNEKSMKIREGVLSIQKLTPFEVPHYKETQSNPKKGKT